MTVQQLQDKIAANSRAWHRAQSQEERDRLHAENVELYGMLDGQTGSQSSFDPENGRWTTNVAGTGDYQGTSAPEARDLTSGIVTVQDAAVRRAVEELGRAKNQAESALDQREGSLGAAYQEAKNRTAAQNEIERKNTGEWASDTGLSSGAAGQIALSQSIAAQGELGALEREEAQEREQVGRERSEMERDYAYAVAEAKAEGDYALADALVREAERFDQAQRQEWLDREAQYRDIYDAARENRRYDTQLQLEQEQRNYDRTLDDFEQRMRYETFRYNQEQDALDRMEDAAALDIRRQQMYNTQAQRSFDNQRKLAQDMAKLGDYQGYRELGFSQDQVDAMEALWRQWKGQ